MITHHLITRPALLAGCLLSLSACSFMHSKDMDYKSATAAPTLEVPPDLLMPAGDDRFAMPAASRNDTTYTAYQDTRSAPRPQADALLPGIDKVRFERAGGQRWLVVDLPPDQVWQVVRNFWQEMGFIINVEAPEAGIMETDWAENRAKIPQGGLRGFFGNLFDGLYSTGERDKFRTRLEPAQAGKSTEIYISHRGMYEVFEGTQGGGDQGRGRTIWQPRAADPELEAEMLRRVMTRFGVEAAQATALAKAPAEPLAQLAQQADGNPVLKLPEAFDRAWRRVGLALDRVGFAVEDRDRAAGVYYVRYIDPEASPEKKAGVLSKLAFWRNDPAKKDQDRFQIKVSEVEQNTVVTVLNGDGTPDSGETGKRIINLLLEQLK